MKTILLNPDGTVSYESGHRIWRDLPTPKSGKVRAVLHATDGAKFPFDRAGCAAALKHQHNIGARYSAAEIPSLVVWLMEEESEAVHVARGSGRRASRHRDYELGDWMNATPP